MIDDRISRVNYRGI